MLDPDPYKMNTNPKHWLDQAMPYFGSGCDPSEQSGSSSHSFLKLGQK
jgi:hypothetical protein